MAKATARSISFGDHERRDVLGAVRWLRKFQAAGLPPHRRRRHRHRRRGASRRRGRSISGGPRDRRRSPFSDVTTASSNLADSAAQVGHQPPFHAGRCRISALPLACVQTGADLWDFSPADAAVRIRAAADSFCSGSPRSGHRFRAWPQPLRSRQRPQKSYLARRS